MQVVKKILIFIFINITYVNCSSQSKIVGNYLRVDPKIATTEIGEEYKFNHDSTFILTRYINLEQVELLKGSYSLVKDTLIIINGDFKSNNATIQKIKAESSGKDYFTAKIKIIDESEKPISGANLLIRNKRGEIVMVFVSDIKGEFPFLSIYDKYIYDFSFSFIGYHENIVEIIKLFGYNATIEVRLSKTEYVSSQQEKKYILKKYTEKELVLSSLEDSEIIILEKK